MQDRSLSFIDLASQVDSLLRQFDALDYFRERVREAAQEHIKAMKEGEHRAKRRRDAVAKGGVWGVALDAAIAKKKTKEGYFYSWEEFRGHIKLPPDITEPLMRLTDRPEFPNRPMEPRCLCTRIPRGNWSEEDEREVEEYHKNRADWEKKKSEYVTAPEGGGPSKWEEDWRPIFELAKKRSFPDDGDGGLPYVFVVEAWLSADLHSDRDGPTDPLPVPEAEMEISLNFRYAGLAAIYDAHWAGSKRIAPWGVVTCGGKVRPASGVLSKWKTPGEPDSYRAASWYCLLVMSAKELDDRNTTIVKTWLADVENDLRENGPKKMLVKDVPVEIQEVLKDLPADDTPHLRVAYRRDHFWLKWHNQLVGKASNFHAVVRDWWNDLPGPHRKIISPRLPGTIGTGRSGAATVRSGITKAKKEPKVVKSKSVRRNAKKRRSPKKT